MRIKGCRTIEEYRDVQRVRIQQWIDRTFEPDCVYWEMHGASNIKVTDYKGDSIIISLDDID